MKTLPRRFFPVFLSMLAATPLARAHPGHGLTGGDGGILHLLGSWDHLLVILGAGLGAALIGWRARRGARGKG